MEILEMGEDAPLKVVGLGTVKPETQLVTSGMIEPAEIQAIDRAGGVGEMLGHFFDRNGDIVETALSPRTLSVSMDKAGDQNIIALAGGPGKIDAIRAILKSGKLSGLVTDERTAKALLKE